MKIKKTVLMTLISILCLTTGLCYLIGLYVKENTASNLYMMSMDKAATFFNTKDITFLDENKHSFSFLIRQDMNISSGIIEGQAEVIGTNENFTYMMRLKILSGSFFNKKHIEKRSNVVVLSSGAAWHFFGNKQSVGNNIIIGNEKFQVIGVLEKNLAQEDEILLYMPFVKLDQLVSGELKVLEIWLQLDNISEVDPIITKMGYSPDNIKLVEMDQYKDVIMQRFKIIIFVAGAIIIILLWKEILNNINALKQEIVVFLKENYIRDIRLIFSNRKLLFRVLYTLVCVISALLLWRTIRFKLCIPIKFFMWKDYNFYVLRDILDFYIQPYMEVLSLQYLNHLNMLSNILFFVSILLVISILCILSRRNQSNLVYEKSQSSI